MIVIKRMVVNFLFHPWMLASASRNLGSLLFFYFFAWASWPFSSICWSKVVVLSMMCHFPLDCHRQIDWEKNTLAKRAISFEAMESFTLPLGMLFTRILLLIAFAAAPFIFAAFFLFFYKLATETCLSLYMTCVQSRGLNWVYWKVNYCWNPFSKCCCSL